MSSVSAAGIYVAALQFHDAILRSCQSLAADDVFRNFPAGCCSDASEILEMYLSELGFGDFIGVMAERGSSQIDQYVSHAWLTQGELIIDITAHQFPEVRERVIVVDRMHSVWHASFNVSGIINYAAERTKPDFVLPCRLRDAYHTVRENIR